MRAVLRELVAKVAGPREWADTREAWLARAATRAGISYRQIKSVWYGEIVDQSHPSVVRLVQAASDYEAISRRLAKVDADFHSKDIAALVDIARALRGLDVARGNKD